MFKKIINNYMNKQNISDFHIFSSKNIYQNMAQLLKNNKQNQFYFKQRLKYNSSQAATNQGNPLIDIKSLQIDSIINPTSDYLDDQQFIKPKRMQDDTKGINGAQASLLTDSEVLNNDETTLLALNQNKFDGLTKMAIWGYGVGHFINDLVAACWFNYLFFYLQRIVKTDAASAAMLAGQIADGVATPVVGYFSDKFTTRWGKRTPWYIGGLILVCICYVPIYHKFNSHNTTYQYLYYTLFPGIFNLGWASLQISHMSLVPQITCSRKRRDKLNNLRNSFTFISNFLVLGMGSIIFKFMTNPPLEYNIISYIVVTLGITASIFFLYSVNQVKLTKICQEKAEILKQKIKQKQQQRKISSSVTQFSEDENDSNLNVRASRRFKQQLKQKQQSIKDWFKMPKFYLFGICYMGVRLYTNMFGTLLPFFLTGVLKLGMQEGSTCDDHVPFVVALVPLIVYFSSALASSRLNWFYKRFGRKKALFLGTIICTICLGVMFFLTPSTGWITYILAVFLGASQTLVLSTGINFISDVVGSKAKTGAFVFGIYSLLDKFSAGLVMFFIGHTVAYKTHPEDLTHANKQFIRYTMVLIPVLSCILATAIVLTYPVEEYSKKHKKDTLIQQDSQGKTRKQSFQDDFAK